jgi:hypothetical protein
VGFVFAPDGTVLSEQFREPVSIRQEGARVKPSVKVVVETSNGTVMKTVVEDYKGQPTAIGREAGLGVQRDGFGAGVDRCGAVLQCTRVLARIPNFVVTVGDRYRANGVEDEVPGFLNTRIQRERLVSARHRYRVVY